MKTPDMIKKLQEEGDNLAREFKKKNGLKDDILVIVGEEQRAVGQICEQIKVIGLEAAQSAILRRAEVELKSLHVRLCATQEDLENAISERDATIQEIMELRKRLSLSEEECARQIEINQEYVRDEQKAINEIDVKIAIIKEKDRQIADLEAKPSEWYTAIEKVIDVLGGVKPTARKSECKRALEQIRNLVIGLER